MSKKELEVWVTGISATCHAYATSSTIEVCACYGDLEVTIELTDQDDNGNTRVQFYEIVHARAEALRQLREKMKASAEDLLMQADQLTMEESPN